MGGVLDGLRYLWISEVRMDLTIMFSDGHFSGQTHVRALDALVRQIPYVI